MCADGKRMCGRKVLGRHPMANLPSAISTTNRSACWDSPTNPHLVYAFAIGGPYSYRPLRTYLSLHTNQQFVALGVHHRPAAPEHSFDAVLVRSSKISSSRVRSDVAASCCWPLDSLVAVEYHTIGIDLFTIDHHCRRSVSALAGRRCCDSGEQEGER
jgi:hypothetical protein